MEIECLVLEGALAHLMEAVMVVLKVARDLLISEVREVLDYLISGVAEGLEELSVLLTKVFGRLEEAWVVFCL